MRREERHTDVVVVGGGMAGIAAAIAAAREGADVILLHNRPVLGGNASSEVRVWVCGATATGHQRFARENGIVGELYLENQFRNPDGNPVFWDAVLLDAIRAEPNISLFLNTDVREVRMDPGDPRRIADLRAWQLGGETEYVVHGEMVIDCTGDGFVGAAAGVRHRIGREGRGEYGEPWAPEEPDDLLLGSTILFYTKDAGHPVDYVAPDFAKDITQTSIPETRVIRAGDNGAAYWWIEWGGELDTVHDNERIRDELWSVIFGIWDHIKNSGRFDAGNMTLEWVGSVPGKREYRRFLGAYTLTQRDILEQTPFDDAIGYGGWSIDLHPPGGMYAPEGGADQWHPDGIYPLPFRSLYSPDAPNLLFAGRDISATHVAFGSTRVMATCAVVGEAAGVAAALCAREGQTPSALAVRDLQRRLLRADAAMVGMPYVDDDDLAQHATVTADSVLRSLAANPDGAPHPLDEDAALVVPVDPVFSGIDLLVDVSVPRTELVVELWDTGLPQNYVPRSLLRRAVIPVEKGERQWVTAELLWEPDVAANAFLIVRANRAVALHVSAGQPAGTISLSRRGGVGEDIDEHIARRPQPVVEWFAKSLRRRSHVFRLHSETDAFRADRVIGGFSRPYGGPQMWSSDGLSSAPTLTVSWPEAVEIAVVTLILDDHVDEYMNNLHYSKTPFRVMPELLRDYDLLAEIDGRWESIFVIEGNRRRRRTHVLASSVRATGLRLVCRATNGSRDAHVFALRVYGPDGAN